MQLVETHVGNLTEGTITVEFHGEGGELVSVRLAAAHVLDGAAAVVRAKAVMVQLTAFADDRDASQDDWKHSW